MTGMSDDAGRSEREAAPATRCTPLRNILRAWENEKDTVSKDPNLKINLPLAITP